MAHWGVPSWFSRRGRSHKAACSRRNRKVAAKAREARIWRRWQREWGVTPRPWFRRLLQRLKWW